MTTRATNVALPEELWEAANILAVRKRISFAELVRRALILYVNGDHIQEFTVLPDGTVDPPEAAGKLHELRQSR